MRTSIIAPRLVATSLIALGSALATGANAQTIIERTITREPVETTVTRTPTGTVITRRPLGAAAETTRASEPRRMTTRQVESRQVSAKRVTDRTSVGKATARIEQRAPAQRRAALTAAERRVVYQTIVEQQVEPAPRVVPPAPYVVPQPRYVAPPLVSAQVALPSAPVAVRQEVIRPAAPVYAVGSVLPPNTPLYAVPQDVALRVPAVQSYSYAYLGGRAYLVDPATGLIVEDVTDE